ncbi:MAG TPA: response regulator transcription factor [Spirochaetia bacterium]|nr:response regulator transcription factor [Spirochaetia bacterium]
MNVHILLVDDHAIVREGLKSLIANQPGMEVIGEASDGLSAVESAVTLKPDIVIMEVMLKFLNGIEATRKILAADPRIKVLCLSRHTDKRSVVQMIRAGASGFIGKTSNFEELLQAIKFIIDGGVYLSPGISGFLVDEIRGQKDLEKDSAYSILTDREREVLQQISEGLTTKEIASSMHVSCKTVETYRKQIMGKVGIHSIAGLTKYAVQQGLSTLSDIID